MLLMWYVMLAHDTASDKIFPRGSKVSNFFYYYYCFWNFLLKQYCWRRVGKGTENCWGVLLPFVARSAFLQNMCAWKSGEIDCLGGVKTRLRSQIFTSQLTGTRKHGEIVPKPLNFNIIKLFFFFFSLRKVRDWKWLVSYNHKNIYLETNFKTVLY